MPSRSSVARASVSERALIGEGAALQLTSKKPARGQTGIVEFSPGLIESWKIGEHAVVEGGVGLQFNQRVWIEALVRAIVGVAQYDRIVVIDIEDDLVIDVAKNGLLQGGMDL